MSLWSNLSGGLGALVGKRRVEREMDEELRGYMQASVEEKMRRGMSAGEAQRAARVEMGSLESVKEEIRGAGWEAAVEALWRDIRSVREDTYPTVFRPLTQIPEMLAQNFEIRTALPLSAMRPAIQRAVAGVDKEIPIEIHTLAAQVDDSLMRERLLAALSAFFGALALLLAMIGLYGTLSYLVTERRAEFGLRMALGAGSRAILGLAMRDVLALVAGGTAAGIGLSLGTGRLLGTLLFGLQPRDPMTMAMAAGLLAAVSLAASYLAARRATKVDPMVALRHE